MSIMEHYRHLHFDSSTSGHGIPLNPPPRDGKALIVAIVLALMIGMCALGLWLIGDDDTDRQGPRIIPTTYDPPTSTGGPTITAR